MEPMTGNDLLSRRRHALAPAYELFYDEPIHMVRGEGVWLFDADGRRYLDCYNNVPSVGHCHPRVVEAIATQARLINTHTRYLHEKVIRAGVNAWGRNFRGSSAPAGSSALGPKQTIWRPRSPGRSRAATGWWSARVRTTATPISC